MRERQSRLPSNGETILVQGIPGAGKSSVIHRVVLREYTEHYRRILIVDPYEDMAKYLLNGNGPIKTRVPLVDIGRADSLATINSAFSPPRESFFMRRKPPKRIVLLYSQVVQREDLLQAFVDHMRNRENRGFVYVCDESEVLFSGSSRAVGDVLEAINGVRNRQQTLILASKRPQNLPTDVRGNANRVLFFATRSTRTIKNGSEELAEKHQLEPALDLPPGKYLYRGPAINLKHTDTLPVFDSLNDPLPW